MKEVGGRQSEMKQPVAETNFSSQVMSQDIHQSIYNSQIHQNMFEANPRERAQSAV